MVFLSRTRWSRFPRAGGREPVSDRRGALVTDNSPHADPDAFEILGMPVSFRLDPAEVRRRRVRALASLQSDPEAIGVDPERFNAAQAALLDPFSRAEILLARLHAPVVDGRLLPDGFLLEMMEWREEADVADAEARTALRRTALERRRAALEAVGDAFAAALSSGAASREQAEEIRRSLNVVRSVDRMIEQLDREDDAA